MNTKALAVFPYVLCAALLAAFFIVHSKRSAEVEALRKQVEATASTTSRWQQVAEQQHQSFISALEQFKDVYASEQRQQTAVIRRVLGNATPAPLPEPLVKTLASLEERIRDESKWPKDANGMNAMLDELRGFTREMPGWAEEDLLPRLNPARWGTSGLALVVSGRTVNNDVLPDFLDQVDTALESKPDGASELVASQLNKIRTELRTRLDVFRRGNAIADAERLLKDGGTADEFSEIQERLSEWAGIPDFKTRIKKLQHDIRARSLSDDTAKFAASVDAALLRISSEPSPMIRQMSLGKLLDGVVTQRQLLLENPDTQENLPRKLAEQSARIEMAIEAEGKAQSAEQEKKFREYQRWALKQISNFDADFKKAQEQKKPGWWAEKTGRWIDTESTYTNFEMIREAMVKHLLPISLGHLDSAVARLYGEAFERGWKKMEDQKNLQTEVAKQEAVVEKHKP